MFSTLNLATFAMKRDDLIKYVMIKYDTNQIGIYTFQYIQLYRYIVYVVYTVHCIF